MAYIPNRLIDTNILSHLMIKNPILEKTNTRLIAFDFPLPKPTEVITTTSVEKTIEKVKDNAFSEMTPGLLNGFLFVSICLIIYYVLYYKYNKKKNQQKNMNYK
jgi:hypothetical protein